MKVNFWESNNCYVILGITPKASLQEIRQVWLVEAKWTGEPADPKDLRDFGGKLATRPGRILGLFVSIAGFTPGAVACPKENRAVGMLLLDAGHLRHVLDGRSGSTTCSGDYTGT